MALTRKMLREMGITDERADEIFKAHWETVEALKGYKAENERLTALTGELQNLRNSLSDYETKYEELKSEYGSFREGISKEKSEQAKKLELTRVLRDMNIPESCVEPILRVTDFESVEMSEDGTLSDEDSVRSGFEELFSGFIPKSCCSGAETASPPNSLSATGYSKEDIRRMSPREINENYQAIKDSLRTTD